MPRPAGSTGWMAASALATLVPGRSWTAVSVELAQQPISFLVSAGVNSAPPSRWVSTSSCVSSAL